MGKIVYKNMRTTCLSLKFKYVKGKWFVGDFVCQNIYHLDFVNINILLLINDFSINLKIKKFNFVEQIKVSNK